MCCRLANWLTDFDQIKVQVEATRLDLLFDVAEHLPTILLPLFAGALSDRCSLFYSNFSIRSPNYFSIFFKKNKTRYGRKPLLYLPIFGSCLASVLSLLHLKFFG